jgi:ketosteroid isomerase-like protein
VARDGWAAGLGAALSDDAVLLQPGEDLARGRAEVGGLLARVAGGTGRPALHRLVGAASADGQLGYTAGWLEEPAPAVAGSGAAPGPSFAKYAAIWRRAGAGYRIEALVRSAARGAPEGPPRSSPVAAGYAGAARPGDRDALRAQVFDADRAFAARARVLAPTKGFGPSFPEFADRNAMLFRPDGVRWGVEEVARVYSESEAGEELSWAPVAGGAAASGDLAWTAGTAIYQAPGEKGARSYTKYLTIWARQPDGSWRWLLDAGNLRPAPAP